MKSSRPRKTCASAALALFTCFVALSLGSGAAAGPEDLDFDPGPTMERLIRRCAADEAALRRFYDRPLSALRLGRLQAFVVDWRRRLEDVCVELHRMGPDPSIDIVLLRNHLDRRAAEYVLQAERNAETLTLLPFAPALLDLETARRGLEAVEPQAAAASLAAALASVREIRKRVERGLAEKASADASRPSRIVALRASKEIEGLARMLKGWFEYRDGYEPEFGWWVRTPYRTLEAALKSYGKFLRERVAGVKDSESAPLVGDPIGREALEPALAREFVPYSPEQLIAIAERELAWCEAEGRKAAAELGVEGGWKAAVEHVKGLHVSPGSQDDLVASQARDVIGFLDEHDLVTVPELCRETWRLEMISEQGQKTLPFAVYSGQSMMVAYATEGMGHEAKRMSMRGNNEHFTRIVTPHELIPGHHLQLFMAERYRSYRSLFRTPFFVEGWALHWEMLLWDLGYARHAADRIGMLFWRMHRCARIIVTLRFHLGEMEPQAMVDFLVQRVGLEKGGATSEVRRYVAGAYGPLYQCAYMLGGLQLRALHGELVGTGKMAQRAFHDAVLRQGSIPFELVRAALTGQVLTPSHRTSWAFYGAVEDKGKMKQSSRLLIAHRGISAHAPENTLPAFRAATQAGAEFVELDYHHTSDGVPVVIHDPTLDRTTDVARREDGKRVSVASKTAAELRRLDAGTWFDARFAGTRIPTLAEALDAIHPHATPLIERKAGDARTLVALLREKELLDDVIVQAFDWDFLADCRRLAPRLKLVALGSKELTTERLDRCAALGVIAIGWSHRDLTPAGIQATHALGLKVYAYTVNDVERVRALLEMGVDGVITDDPEAVAGALR